MHVAFLHLEKVGLVVYGVVSRFAYIDRRCIGCRTNSHLYLGIERPNQV